MQAFTTILTVLLCAIVILIGLIIIAALGKGLMAVIKPRPPVADEEVQEEIENAVKESEDGARAQD